MLAALCTKATSTCTSIQGNGCWDHKEFFTESVVISSTTWKPICCFILSIWWSCQNYIFLRWCYFLYSAIPPCNAIDTRGAERTVFAFLLSFLLNQEQFNCKDFAMVTTGTTGIALIFCKCVIPILRKKV